MTWQTFARLEHGDIFALCRCGGSQNKPFCDGSHLRNNFDGTETAPTNSYAERAQTYQGEGIVVRDDRAICEHAGFCGNRLTNVWKMVRDTDDSVVRTQVMAMIENCPSGALTFRLKPGTTGAEPDLDVDSTDGEPDLDVGGADVEPDLDVGIGVTKDGPYFVTGKVDIERSDGESLETRNRMTLCRCGQSKNKPLCDGSHQAVGFSDS